MEETGAPAEQPAQPSPTHQPADPPTSPPADPTSAPSGPPSADPTGAQTPADHLPWQRPPADAAPQPDTAPAWTPPGPMPPAPGLPTAPVPPQFTAPTGTPGRAWPPPGYLPPGQAPGQVPPYGPPPWQGAPGWGQFPPPPPGAPAPFSAPPAKFPRWVVVAVVIAALLTYLGFLVFNIFDGVRQAKDDFNTLGNRDPGWATTDAPTPFATGPEAGPSAGADPSPTGPRAATYPVRNDDDLARVCDGWYYPQSPKFTGKAPHQISVGVVDSVKLPSRHILAAVTVPDLRESIWRAWIPENAGKTQLVACVDLTRSGSKLKSCKYDDPTPETVGLTQGFYRLRLYEAATGKKLLDKPVTGEDERCPSAIFLAEGEGLYSEVDDRQLYELLKGFVMKKM